ncbi:hypothetical protein SASPL_138636 [Salvia splendens]|uniref:Uncharacterized protein n=1 Tax=Salvia splendens TaxID=180675 RepID=A0A8X8ZEC2_SALSN|nr:hypothetical protein SASPL_138636 [Salvia splendens]
MAVEEGDATPPLPSLHRDEFRSAAATSPPPPWSIVAIINLKKHELDNPPIVFPPIDHENLHISPQLPPYSHQIYNIHAGNRQISFSDSDSDFDLNSSSTFSPSDSSPRPLSPVSLPRPADSSGWFNSWTELLNPTKINELLNQISQMNQMLIAIQKNPTS